MGKILITDHVGVDTKIEESMFPDHDLLLMQTSVSEEFMPEAADAIAVMNTYAGPIGAKEMDQLAQCVIIARYGIGYDTIDVDAATERGILVSNNPHYCVDEVAEHTLAMILAGWRQVAWQDRLVRSDTWKPQTSVKMHRLKGKTIGLLGFGAIARSLAQRCAALGLEIIFYDPFVESSPLGRKVELSELSSQSDIVSVHVPLMETTTGMIGKDFLSSMKETALLVNCSRGAIVDNEALINALTSGNIAGAALDTAEGEPIQVGHPLLNFDNVTMTPHSAWYSEDSMIDLRRIASENVRSALNGVRPQNLLNPEVLDNDNCRLPAMNETV